MNRIIIIFFLLLSAMVAFADKRMTFRNTDTEESFEVTTPNGIKIHEININWLDSVPYLTEHARWGEPWAYEALAECHRHGKGGLKRSFINALSYYKLAGKNEDDYMAEIAEANHEDPIVVFSRLDEYLENKDYDRIICAIDTLNEAGYYSANVLLKSINNSKQVELEDILKFATDSETDPDASLLACIGYALFNKYNSTKIGTLWAKTLIMDKLPYMYSLAGKEKYETTLKSHSSMTQVGDISSQDIEERRNAVEYFLKADKYGALSKQAARLLHHYLTCDPTSKWVNFSEEDIRRLQILADIDE